MAQVCEICGKGPQFGNKISHAISVQRRWNVNLRPIKAKVTAVKKPSRCTSCIKAGKVVRLSVIPLSPLWGQNQATPS